MRHGREDYQLNIVDLRDPAFQDALLNRAREEFAKAIEGWDEATVDSWSELMEDAVRMALPLAVGGIPAEEPVFLLRGQDEVAPSVVKGWADLARLCGADQAVVGSARVTSAMMHDWQAQHGSKIPDAPPAEADRG
jgi:hypothetical protein